MHENSEQTEKRSIGSSIIAGAIVLTVFLAIEFIPRPLVSYFLPEGDPYLKWSLRSILEVGGVLVAVIAIYRTDLFGAFREIRLTSSFTRALGFGFLVTFPMVLAFGLTSDIGANLDLRKLVFSTAVAGFVEEVVFRGFAFWMLYRYAGWNFWPAALIPALVFGYGHLYQSPDLMEATGIFAITAVGSVWFSWLLLRWDNLWVPIIVHMLMNFWWDVFAVDETALGGWLANVSRFAVIALSIIVTVNSKTATGNEVSNHEDSRSDTDAPS